MFRPVGIVVAVGREAYFFAVLALAAGFALADLAGFAALVVFLAVVLAGAAFFVAISLAPLEKNIGYRFGKHVVSLWYPRQRATRNRDTLQKSDDSSLKLSADRTSRIVEVFVNCVKRNLLMSNTLSKSVTPQPKDESTCITDVSHATHQDPQIFAPPSLVHRASQTTPATQASRWAQPSSAGEGLTIWRNSPDICNESEKNGCFAPILACNRHFCVFRSLDALKAGKNNHTRFNSVEVGPSARKWLYEFHPFSPVLQQLKPSATLAAAAKAKELKAKGINVLDFTLGEPDFITRANIREAAVVAMNAGHTHYTASGGILELKQAVCAAYQRDYGLKFAPNQVLISCGKTFHSQCAFFPLRSRRRSNHPCTVLGQLYALVEIAGAIPVLVNTTEASGFCMSAEQFAAAITPKTRLLMLNNPSNPTGCTYPVPLLEELGASPLKRIFWCSLMKFMKSSFTPVRNSAALRVLVPMSPRERSLSAGSARPTP